MNAKPTEIIGLITPEVEYKTLLKRKKSVEKKKIENSKCNFFNVILSEVIFTTLKPKVFIMKSIMVQKTRVGLHDLVHLEIKHLCLPGEESQADTNQLF